VREEFMPWLEDQYPDLVPRYRQMYGRPYASAEERKALGARVAGIVRALGGTRPDRGGDADRPERWNRTQPRPEAKPQQLKLV
jgi:hypothetical protein